MEEKGSMMNRTIKAAVGMIAIAAMSVGTLAACGSDSSSSDGKGKVYYLNFKPEANDAWQALAKKYTKKTGVEVKVQTAASGTYEQTLKSEIAKSEAPTLFQVNGPVGYQNWKSYTADMSDTEPYKELIDQSVALKDGDKVVGVPYAMETYGIIYNKDILNKYIATDGAKIKSVDDIDNFDTLKAVADDMQAKKDELGIKGAFTSAGFDSSSDWRFKTHLANLPLYYEFKQDKITEQPETIKGTYLPQYKQIFDLYLKDSTTEPTQLSSKTGDDATSEFSLGEAAFYQNGTWAWSDLNKNGMKADSLGMLPIYIGVKGEEKQGLVTGSENYWCINDKASDADKKATKDFLKWVITDKDGIESISSDMGLTTPFKTFSDVKSDNPLTQAAVEDQNSGKTAVSWNFTMMPSEEWKNKLGSALLEYAQGTGDWNAVKTAFVDGWKTEYDAAH
ncbi:ABC transporter substrate-binding protein [Bifidobacterium dentium]|uniref:Solute binding protein of ABC transporter system for sugars n=1 Tax=Bifidobacterium dentium (strain ATCC 27534 / DSM 20436 / JCM 1195 / Bd1) TaxID=401473 RepID=D2Q7K1_BIFDB|nr:ABC transporter substrate-binding protein [Bifidobacterium dentium]ADB10763.1 Solute binding protein of ABC transporter system for sugars [Bifidobacterium dentium Bd1]EDT45045.1 ABC transporter, solute-binding protein [Bifidobacterium dentium ATCC 27678]SEC14437.1 carbohydrate ABC transporter substrate-binding protein, CUT1 family [Bifidobacterium dentium JCM 1195 = DSM 20436]VEG24743.1 sugars ABC transporter substrate-binding protein [Bifidobacterium dentium]BAQ28069.1 ABC transporter subs